MPSFFSDTLDTSLGRVALAVNADGALAALIFVDTLADAPAIAAALRAYLGPDSTLAPDPARTAAARAELTDYFAGKLRRFSTPVAPVIGSPFQRRVWAALTRIPYGETWSYARLAQETGSVARAVGSANGANPVSIVVPCHRVIGANGDLTGYAGGLERKRALLQLEGALLA